MARVRSKHPIDAGVTGTASVIPDVATPPKLIGSCTDEPFAGASTVPVATANEDALGTTAAGDLSISTEESVAIKDRSMITDAPALCPLASGLACCGMPTASL